MELENEEEQKEQLQSTDKAAVAMDMEESPEASDDEQRHSQSQSHSILKPMSMQSFRHIGVPVSLTWNNIRYEVDVKRESEEGKGGKDGEDGEDNTRTRTKTKSNIKNKTKKVILDNISGYAEPGKVLCILGPSGSGKTTLLQILSGTRDCVSGTIMYQGRQKRMTKFSSDIMGFQGNSAYILQEDLLHGSLTVRENLRYAAQLKITESNLNKAQIVTETMAYLGLTSCADAVIGDLFRKGVSGGQKRRVSIGVELMSQPGLLFMDEVTSGLDATSTYQLMHVVQKLAQLGHTVLMTVHQPSSRIFDMFCENAFTMLILEKGRCMYFGPAADIVRHFESNVGYSIPSRTNPCDYILDLVNSDFQASTEKSDHISQVFDEQLKVQVVEQRSAEINENAKVLPIPVMRNRHFMTQIGVLLKRNFINHLRNPSVFWVRIAMYLMLCLCVGSMYWNIGTQEEDVRDRISILFFVAGFLTFMSISGMPAFVEERSVFMKERMNNHYNTFSYCVANFLSSIPWIFLIAVMCSMLIYTLIQSRQDAEGYHFGIYLANLFLALMVAESLMVAISGLSSIFMVGLAMGAGLLGLYMILCGFFLLPSNIPAGWKWVHHGVSFHTYTFRVLMYNEFHKLDKGDIDGEAVLKLYEMEDTDLNFCFGILIAMMVFYRLLFYAILSFFNRRHR